MNETLTGILRILSEGDPDRQVAAAQILGELRPKDSGVVKALASTIQNGSHFLKPFALEALAAIRSREALHALLPLLHDTGELRGKAVQALSQVGPSVEGLLAKEFQAGGSEVRAAVLEIVARTRGREAFSLLEKALTGPDAELAAVARRVLAAELPSFREEERKKLAEALASHLARAARAKARPGDRGERTADVLDLLGLLAEPKQRTLLAKFTRRSFPPAVRRAALSALARLPEGGPAGVELLDLLEGDQFQTVGAPALEVLRRSRLAPGASSRLARFLKSRHADVRAFALEAFARFPTARTVGLLLPFLGHQDARLRETAAASLARIPAARPVLLRKLLAARSHEEALRYARPLRALVEGMGTGGAAAQVLRSLAERTYKHFQTGSPMRDVLASLLFAAGKRYASAYFLEKARRLRRSRQFKSAVSMLLFLASLGGLDDEVRYELVLSSLLAEPRDVDSRVGDPVLGHTAELLRNSFPLLARLKKESQLGGEHLLYLGWHSAEKLHEERRVGVELLRHVVKRWPRTKAAVQARQKLRLLGLEDK